MVNGDERSALERAQGVEDVADRVVDEGGAARVATLVGRQRHRTEACERLRPRLGRGHAFGDELLGLPFEMEGELVVELAFDAARREQRPGAQLPVAEAHRVYASFMTRPIAADIRSHSRASTASCRRPDRGELVVLRPPAELGDGPLRLDPALMLEAMQRGIERALVDLQHVFGDLLDALRDRPAVQRLRLERPQDHRSRVPGDFTSRPPGSGAPQPIEPIDPG